MLKCVLVCPFLERRSKNERQPDVGAIPVAPVANGDRGACLFGNRLHARLSLLALVREAALPGQGYLPGARSGVIADLLTCGSS